MMDHGKYVTEAEAKAHLFSTPCFQGQLLSEEFKSQSVRLLSKQSGP